jgi:hypothetical protein
MPRVRITTVSGAEHEVRVMPAEDTMALVENYQSGTEPVISLIYGELGNNDMLHLSRLAIESILIEDAGD